MYKILKTIIIACFLLIGTQEIIAQTFPNGYQKLDCCACNPTGNCVLIADSDPAVFNTADGQLFILVDVDNETIDGDDDDNLIDVVSTIGSFSVTTGDYIMYYLSFDYADFDDLYDVVQEGIDINNLINLGTQSGENTWYSSDPSFTLIATDLATATNNCCFIDLQIWQEIDGNDFISPNVSEEILAGILITLYDESGNLVEEYIINENSIIDLNEIPFGNYYFVIDTMNLLPNTILTNEFVNAGETSIAFDEAGISTLFSVSIQGGTYAIFAPASVEYTQVEDNNNNSEDEDEDEDELYFEVDNEETIVVDVDFADAELILSCEDFNAIATAICSTDKSTYNILLSFIGGDAGENGYNILSNNTGASFNNITAPTMNLGPFEAGTGFSYTISVADYPECTIVLTTAIVDCIVTSIELINFIGDVLKEGNELVWNVASENNTDFYTIEYSENGIDFKEVGIVRGNGNSSISQQYVFLHEVQEDGEYYYRLQETDLDGRTSIASDVISLQRMSNGFVITNVYPIPTSDWINIDFTTEKNDEFSIEVMDITGKILQTKNHTAIIGNNQIRLNASTLTAGTYFISISNGEETLVDKFVKN